MESELGIPVLMENDANCFALAEAILGAAKDYRLVFGVVLGTGCGGGVVINKNIHRGPNHIGGEWGHHVLYPNGRDCYCGNKGCTESYISGTALEKEWEELTGEFKCVTDIIDEIPILVKTQTIEILPESSSKFLKISSQNPTIVRFW